MKKDYNLIGILNPIGNFKTYSKYSDSLEKLFKKKCLRTLLYSLKNPVKLDDEEIAEKLSKKETERYHSRDSNKKCLLDYNYDDYLKRQKELFRQSKKTEPWSINLNTPRMPQTQRNLDFYKYNPNYNSIYKNVPSFAFVPKSKRTIDYDDSKFDHKTKKISRNLYSKDNLINKSKSLGNKFFPLLTSISNKSMKNETSKNKIKHKKKDNTLYDRNNHSFRFSKYCSRKPVEAKVNNKVTYLENYDYLIHMNKTIDFQKMAKRNDKNLLINTYTLKNPSMCYYNPKFNCIETKPKDISFNPDDFKKSQSYKKNKTLKRILVSYDVNREYGTIDNTKLVKPESIAKLLNL